MRAVAETAIRWRAGVTSFHMVLQMAARTVLAGGDYLGALKLPAGGSGSITTCSWGRFTSGWLFSWLFSDVIPLHRPPTCVFEIGA
jgi:hypothetical protein